MASTDLDKIHEKRIEDVVKRWHEVGELNDDEIFVSECVIDSIDHDKALIEWFDLPKILALLPFTPIVYVEICPHCINGSNFEVFKSLTISGLAIPILIYPYNQYPTQVQELLRGRDHMSCYEYELYRNAAIHSLTDTALCGHCVDKRADELAATVKGKRNAPLYRQHLNQILHNISPYVDPDFELLNDVSTAFDNLNVEWSSQLKDMSEVIRSLRSAQAFNAAISINEGDFSDLPSGLTCDNDSARQLGLELKEFVSNGLGLQIPTDINIEQYVELIKDFRPQIISVTDEVMHSATADGELSIRNLQGTISSINTEIERIKGLKRYMLYEAGVEFVGKNKTLVASTFIASALGIAGSFAGCIGVASAGTAANIAKKKGKLKTGKSINRLSTKIHRDLQPDIDKLVSRYVGTEVPAMRVISIRKAVDNK